MACIRHKPDQLLAASTRHFGAIGQEKQCDVKATGKLELSDLDLILRERTRGAFLCSQNSV